jgi:hypothetical protein
MACVMEKDSRFGLMVQNMMANGETIRLTVMEN